MSLSNDKVQVNDEPFIKDDSGYQTKDYPKVEIMESDNSSVEEGRLTEQEAGDAALANAPWQYKLIALVTALLFPSKVDMTLLCVFYTNLCYQLGLTFPLVPLVR
jgi:hypothetical protein